jgi:hypothetical protein
MRVKLEGCDDTVVQNHEPDDDDPKADVGMPLDCLSSEANIIHGSLEEISLFAIPPR